MINFLEFESSSSSNLSLDFTFLDPICSEEFLIPLQKFEDYSENTQIYSLYMNICGRRQMQDRHKIYTKYDHSNKVYFFAVYDGHGSEKVAELLAAKLHLNILENPDFHMNPHQAIETAFANIDREAIETFGEDGGSVALCAIIINHKLFVINLGDSRAILIKKDRKIVQLSNEHTPEKPEESSRIEKLGGYILTVGEKARVQGSLAVSRAVGDKFYKPFVSYCPEILEYELELFDKYLILGTDGLWNEISNEEVGDFLREKALEDCSKKLMESIIEKKGFIEDNTTILCVDLEEIKKDQMVF